MRIATSITLLLPAAAVASALAITTCRLNQTPAKIVAPKPAAKPPAPAPTPPPPLDLAQALRTIGIANGPTNTVGPTSEPELFADHACTRATPAETAALRTRLARWLAARAPGTHPHPDYPLAISTGCIDPTTHALVVAVGDERIGGTDDAPRDAVNHSFVLRVFPRSIDILAAKTATGMDQRMEWADEGYVGALALSDIDGDGREDVLVEHVEHEGGARQSEVRVDALLSSKPGPVAVTGITGDAWATAANGRLVLVLASDDHNGEPVLDAATYACLASTDAHLEHCPAAAEAHRADEAGRIALRYAGGIDPDVIDRDTLADELATLQVPARDGAALLAAARAPTPRERATRQIASLVTAALPEDAIANLRGEAHPIAQQFLTDIRAALGDVRCTTPATIAPALRTRALAFARTRGKPDAKGIALTPACGAYVWAAWTEQADFTRHVALLFDQNGHTSEVLARTRPLSMPNPVEIDALDAGFVLHDGTIVGTIIDDEDGSPHAVANGSVVSSPAATGMPRYRYADRWADSAEALIGSGDMVLHATAHGFERVTLPAIVQHEAERAALATLADLATTPPPDAATLRHALEVLHADPALVDLVAHM